MDALNNLIFLKLTTKMSTHHLLLFAWKYIRLYSKLKEPPPHFPIHRHVFETNMKNNHRQQNKPSLEHTELLADVGETLGLL